MPHFLGKHREPQFYVPHEGTLKISGKTIPGKAAGRASSLLKRDDIENIDFFLIGGNANQQAMKAMGLFRVFLEDDTDGRNTLAFTPLHVRTMADNLAHTEQMSMDATVWRTVILNQEQSQKVIAIEVVPAP